MATVTALDLEALNDDEAPEAPSEAVLEVLNEVDLDETSVGTSPTVQSEISA